MTTLAPSKSRSQDAAIYSPIEHLSRSLWLGRFKYANRMAMYSTFFDESGHPDDSRFVVVAGCVADVEQWVHFEREWNDALRPHGISIFHAAETGWIGPQELEGLLQRLVGIIRRRVEKIFSYAIPMDRYNAINGRYVFGECFGFPYPLAARYCMNAVREWASKHSIPGDEIKHFFENGAKHKGQIEWIAERDRLSIPTFLEKSEAVPLQAADLIAWVSNLYLTSGGRIDPRYRRVMDELARHSSDWGIVTLEDPERLPTVLGIPLRDPELRYKCKIMKSDGRRRPIVHYWPKSSSTEPKVERKTLVIPELEPLSALDLDKAFADYDAARAKPEVS